MTRTPPAHRPVARLRGPAELAAALPHLCGFVPTESLVVVALHGPRSRIGLTLRVDLPAPGAEASLVAEVVGRLRRTAADSALSVVCSQDGDDHGLPRAGLVTALLTGLREAGLTADEALLVRGGRWWSYVCGRERCCPPQGRPLDDGGSPGLALVRAHEVLQGRAVLPCRADLVASLAAPGGLAAGAARSRLGQADAARRRRTAAEGRTAVGRDALHLWRGRLGQAAEPPVELPPGTAAHLTVSLGDPLVRDEVLTWLLDDAEALLTLLLALASQCVAPWDAPVCTLLAWVGYARGDGGLANVALDRALGAQPGYPLALLARQVLEAQVRPAQVRALLAESRRVLRVAHPWTSP